MTTAELRLTPRYHRWHVDEGVDWLESNTFHGHLDWSIPRSQCALVLLDVWNQHYLKDTEARAERIIQQKLRPLVTACRGAHLPIVHAPSPDQAQKHAQWLQLPGWDAPSWPQDASWPPSAFRRNEEEFARYRLPDEPRDAEREAHRAGLRIHPDIEPTDGEPVIATGQDRTIREFCEVAFGAAGLNWEDHVVIDEAFFRPAEVEILTGDPTKAQKELGWRPEVSFEEMVRLMVENDLEVVGSHK